MLARHYDHVEMGALLIACRLLRNFRRRATRGFEPRGSRRQRPDPLPAGQPRLQQRPASNGAANFPRRAAVDGAHSVSRRLGRRTFCRNTINLGTRDRSINHRHGIENRPSEKLGPPVRKPNAGIHARFLRNRRA